MPQLTWLITGCSSGFGEEFVKSLLKRGDRVIATARNNAEARLANLSKLGAAVLDLDVTLSQDLLDKRVEEAIQVYGVIDVLINCAGYVEAGMVEQTSHERFTKAFNTNVFGVINVTRAVLPHFRSKKSGTVVFLSSSGGMEGEPGAGAYCATKFALEGVFECLRMEIAGFGLQSFLFQLGFFRTKIFHPDNLKVDTSPEATIADYAEMNTLIGGFIQQMNGSQPGDPKKAVKIMIDIVRGEGVAEGKVVPERLPLGSDIFPKIKNKYTKYLEVCDEWESIITSTDLAEEEKGNMRVNVSA